LSAAASSALLQIAFSVSVFACRQSGTGCAAALPPMTSSRTPDAASKTLPTLTIWFPGQCGGSGPPGFSHCASSE
jgi:hypothetical protein